MLGKELIWLAEKASTHNVIVEIGSYLGRSTRALADNTPGIVYAIDDWYGPRDVDWLKDESRVKILAEFTENMKGVEGKVVVLNIDHGEAAIPVTPDMVFIDGDHEYENVKRDIEIWLPRLTHGGLICGHDADKPGVRKAITEAFGSWIRVSPDTNIWYVEV